MKICYIISEIDKAVFFEQTALELRKRELDVSYILINCKGGHLSEFLHVNGFPVYEFENKRLINSRKTIQQVRSTLKREKISVVHCHLAHANWVGLWAARLAGIKRRIYTRHSGEPLQLSRKEKSIDKLQNLLATEIISISQNIDDLLAKQGVPQKKRKLIHHGFDLERFENADENEVIRLKLQYNPQGKLPVIGIVARWMEWKGIQYIIEGFKEILQNYPDALICFFGVTKNADYYGQLTSLLLQIPAENYKLVEFEKNVFDLYQLFDVYVHTPVNSTSEAFGQTYVEALAAGIPSVFTLSGVAREFIADRENALVVPFRNSHAISSAVSELLENEALRNKLVTNGKLSVQGAFAFSNYISQLTAFYGVRSLTDAG